MNFSYIIIWMSHKWAILSDHKYLLFYNIEKKKSFLSLKQLALVWIPGMLRFSKLVICDMTLNIWFK